MTIRITCINKAGGDHFNQHEAISFLGWLDESTGKYGKCSLAEMVKFIEDGGTAYVRDAFNNVAYLIVRTSTWSGRKFVQTISDNKPADNLLSLMECR